MMRCKEMFVLSLRWLLLRIAVGGAAFAEGEGTTVLLSSIVSARHSIDTE